MHDKIINILKKLTSQKEIILEVPPSPHLGDYAFPCFELAKKQKKSPIEISKELSIKFSSIKGIERIQPTGPYLNFFLDKSIKTEQTLKKIIKEKGKYGSKNLGKKQRVMIEFSQPNTHKAFHIGHLRGTSIGEAISRILEFNNFKVIRANYMGDTGAHVAKWIWHYKKSVKNTPPKQ